MVGCACRLDDRAQRGAAAAVGLLPFADGPDLAASVRNPASMCSLVGLRTTPARSRTAAPVLGPIARSAADVDLLPACAATTRRCRWPGPEVALVLARVREALAAAGALSSTPSPTWQARPRCSWSCGRSCWPAGSVPCSKPDGTS